MGECGLCNREMTDKEPCKRTKRIKFADGEVMDALPAHDGIDDDGFCYDCWTPEGEMHHPRCDWETCPRCGGQLLGCDCKVEAHFTE